MINDAYNANPASMAAALDALGAVAADRRIAVLGLMAELDDPAAAHRAIAATAGRLGIELVAVETEHYGVTADRPVRTCARRSARSPPAPPCSSRAASSPGSARSPTSSGPGA